MELGTMATARRQRRATGLPERLRSALSARGWVRRPEPRVRFGQRVLPGVNALGPVERAVAGTFVERAQALRAGVVTHLGRSVDLGDPFDWFPRGTSVAWQAALHGLDEVLAVGVAAVTAPTAEERRMWYELATTVLRDWTHRVPAGHPVAWSVPALARRIRNVLIAQALLAPELRQDAATRGELLVGLYEQASALAAAPRSTGPDPWSIAAGNALFLAGRFFDGMEARSWVDAGAALLWGQLREQIYEDGGHASRSPVWQAFVLAEYVTAFAVLRADNDDVPIWGRKRVKGMADCLARLAHADGTLPAFDPVPADDVWPVPELLATTAVVLHEPAFAALPELGGVWPLLVVGENGRRAYAGVGRAEPVAMARALRRTGFFVLASDPGDAMVIDGAVRRCADGPAAFGYELSIGGLPLVVGSRVGFEEPGAIAEHARGARARNVLAVGYRGAADSGAVETHFTVRDGVQYFLGTCHGFGGVGPGLQYRRRIFCLPGRFWLVCEELSGTGTFSGESLVHLHPASSVRGICAGRPMLDVRRGEASAMTVLAAGVKSLGLAGGVAPPQPQGWYALEDRWVEAPVVVLRTSGTLPLVLGYALVPRPETPIGDLKLHADPFELRATLCLGDIVYELRAVQDEVELVTRPA